MSPLDVTAPVLPGETLAGKYKIERVLGRGGMGIVVAARHLDLEERVAIKFMLRSDDPIALERFVREARAAVKVKSEHVCRVLDVGRLDTGEPYMVMEYLEGTDLARLLARDKRATTAQVAGWMIEACAALSEAHAIGIVHRDLKPANLFLSLRNNGSACLKVLDFGISKLVNADAMTSTSVTMGSPAYMSPEQIVSSRDVDARTDVWSLGVMMHELVTGTVPFAADTLIQLSVKIRETEPPSIASLVDDIAPGFEAIVAKCLQKQPADRYASVGELAAALAQFADARLRRTSDASALLGTELDHSRAPSPQARSVVVPSGDVEARGAPDGAPSPGASKDVVTLEPLSRVSAVEPSSSSSLRRWAGSGGLIVAALGVFFATKPHGGEERSGVSADAQVVATGEVETSVTRVEVPEPTSASAKASAGPTSNASSTASVPARGTVRANDVRFVDAGAAGVGAVASAIASPPVAVDAGKPRRSLDRSDPYD